MNEKKLNKEKMRKNKTDKAEKKKLEYEIPKIKKIEGVGVASGICEAFGESA